MKHRIALLMALLLLLTGCAASPDASADPTPTQAPTAINTKDMDFSFTDRELAGTWESQKAINITGNGDTFTTSGQGAQLTDGQMLITSGGVYVLAGTFSTPVVIRAGETDKVQLVLNSAEITCADGPAILIESADKVFITLAKGTDNRVTDGASYASTEAGSPDGAIFSRADLCLNGSGSLIVTGQYKHGIVSKDDLVIASCTLQVKAASTGLDGKDCVKATGADIAIEAGSNGVRSDNAEDASRGFIYLQDCSLNVVAGSDGLQAQTVLQAENVRMQVTAGGGSDYSIRNAEGSWKGLKSGGDMLLNGGEYDVSSRDDCIHSNSNVVITAGTFHLSSGDDGIHADTALTISGGEIFISKSYEGLEASKLTIAGGRISVVASDDGLNAAGGADGSAMGNRFGRGMFSNGVGEIVISGGYTFINAKGDGIDSNNSILVTGGVTLVSGPVSSGNAAFDYDGTAKVTGGVLIATGASGMAQNFSEAEGQGAMLLTFTQRASGSIALLDASGQVIASFTPDSTYQSAVITAPDVQQGRTYSVLIGGTVEGADDHGFAQHAAITGGQSAGSITMDSMLYGGGQGMGNRPGGGGGRMPGGPGGGGGGPGGWRGW